ncbi:MAG: bifunctional hydroxymethylpyrimidine kinase/phosphomethylpyrimidine kinase [Chloroflexaceae bacterium]|nr:bifunctional hydroxymethylpyrimidine kinase/phosphomethylpyrimidine kinase [Chloroflexaceae bacterium]
MVKTALTIAGSDSGGGAGIQADLRTFAFHCVHGTSALTCVTAQNTVGVLQVMPLPAELVVAQIAAVASDIGVAAFKTGMLFNEEIMIAVAQAIADWQLGPFVLDPVMVSRSGAILIDQRAIAALKSLLLPLACAVTPNRYEAQLLSGREIQTLADMQAAAAVIHDLGARAVLVKGGNLPGALQGTDVWFDGKDWEILRTEAVVTRHNHGTGCTLSAAIAANLALGKSLLAAVRDAKDYVTTALNFALDIGAGSGPVGHFFPLLPPP